MSIFFIFIISSIARFAAALSLLFTASSNARGVICLAAGEAGGVHTYGLILREAEELSLEVLLIDGMELHPYDTPEIIATVVENVSFEYLAWVKDNVKSL